MQQDGNKFKQWFRQTEMNALLKDCRAGLQHAVEAFKIVTSHSTLTDITEMRTKTQQMHQELLDFISNDMEGTMSETTSTIYQTDTSENSLASLDMLPSQPALFHGREAELMDILKTLNTESPRVAILGAPGMGKTSLARAVLHHPGIVAKYEHRLFVSADSATNSNELAALIASYLRLKPGKSMKNLVVQHFSKAPPSLLILDNMETPWESLQNRSEVEEFLSLLTDISQLALIITMRGAERPAKVHWTHPFLQPLAPLSADAARQTFIDIADDFHDSGDMDKVLLLTNNLPLAIDLIAHQVNYEGCVNVLNRWENEKTCILSDGHDRRSNLDMSIGMSISSPRMTSGAKDLFSLLSILPDGLSSVELLQANLGIPHILKCKASLLATSLAYTDADHRVKMLMPIRQYAQQHLPATKSLLHPLQSYFHSLLELYRKERGISQMDGGIKRLTLNLGNVQEVLRQGLQEANNVALSVTIECTISFSNFSRINGHGYCSLMDHLQEVFPQLSDPQLELQFITELFHSSRYWGPRAPHCSNSASFSS
ncbi:P-loop containing nucleoside triphosphate hydrolase protein [Mycena polygramma]|nr:P-loop containing nucleoside triphosphate hydrolase protein [Mycena polygramma]